MPEPYNLFVGKMGVTFPGWLRVRNLWEVLAYKPHGLLYTIYIHNPHKHPQLHVQKVSLLQFYLADTISRAKPSNVPSSSKM